MLFAVLKGEREKKEKSEAVQSSSETEKVLKEGAERNRAEMEMDGRAEGETECGPDVWLNNKSKAKYDVKLFSFILIH